MSTKTIQKLNCASQLRALMAEYFTELDLAAATKEKKIAWCTSVGPAELLRAFGFLVYFPENHGAMLGASRMASDLIPYANAIGYSPDICSYLTSDIGSFLAKSSALSKAYPGMIGPPKPDVLVFNTNQCRDVRDWFSFYQKQFDVPMLGIATHRMVDEVNEGIVSSIANQIEAMIPELERITATTLDFSRLASTVARSKRTSELWEAVLKTAVNKPAPLSFFDATVQMGPAVVLRGDDRANGYYETLLDELNERVSGRIGAVETEKFRLYWEGMPIWGKLREHAEMFLGLDTCIVASTYCNSWIFSSFDPDDPIRSMAKAYTELFIVRSENYKKEYLERMADHYLIDGFLFHDAKTCPNNSNNRYGLPESLTKTCGQPTLTINGDLNDLRCYSDEQSRTSIEAFIEQIAANR